MLQQSQIPSNQSCQILSNQKTFNQQSFRATFESQKFDTEPPQFLKIITCLTENRVFLYMNNGEYIIYNLHLNQNEKIGKIEGVINSFTIVLEKNEVIIIEYFHKQIFLAYVNESNKKLMVFDITNCQEVLTGPSLPTETAAPINSNEETKVAALNNAKIFCVPGKEDEKMVYIIVQEESLYFQNNNDFKVIYSVCEFSKTGIQDKSSEKFQGQYIYPNSREQNQIFQTQIDPNTLAFYGQDFEAGQVEFLLLRPKLGKNFGYIVGVPDKNSIILSSITNWCESNYLALWFNGNSSDCPNFIDILDYEQYLKPQENKEQIQPRQYSQPIRKPLTFENDIMGSNDSILVQVHFMCDEFAIVEKLVGLNKYLQLVDMRDFRVLHSLTDLNSLNMQVNPDGSYIASFDSRKQFCRQFYLQSLDPHSKKQNIYFDVHFILDQRLQTLHYASIILEEQSKLPSLESLVQDVFSLLFKRNDVITQLD